MIISSLANNVINRIFLPPNGWHNLHARPGNTFHLAVRKPINAGIGAGFAFFSLPKSICKRGAKAVTKGLSG
jgi:hypothetical protein